MASREKRVAEKLKEERRTKYTNHERGHRSNTKPGSSNKRTPRSESGSYFSVTGFGLLVQRLSWQVFYQVFNFFLFF